jgi:hypothetical protein
VARHHAFRMDLVTGPTSALCDICMQPVAETSDDKYFQTYVANQMQSALCVECVVEGKKLLMQSRRVGPLAVEA